MHEQSVPELQYTAALILYKNLTISDFRLAETNN